MKKRLATLLLVASCGGGNDSTSPSENGTANGGTTDPTTHEEGTTDPAAPPGTRDGDAKGEDPSGSDASTEGAGDPILGMLGIGITQAESELNDEIAHRVIFDVNYGNGTPGVVAAGPLKLQTWEFHCVDQGFDPVTDPPPRNPQCTVWIGTGTGSLCGPGPGAMTVATLGTSIGDIFYSTALYWGLPIGRDEFLCASGSEGGVVYVSGWGLRPRQNE